MSQYVLRRLLIAVPSLLGISLAGYNAIFSLAMAAWLGRLMTTKGRLAQ